jgi:hypothetical protein
MILSYQLSALKPKYDHSDNLLAAAGVSLPAPARRRCRQTYEFNAPPIVLNYLVEPD